LALTPDVADVEGKRAQWTGFVRWNRLTTAPAGLDTVTEAVAAFIRPVLTALARKELLAGTWPPGGPWEAAASRARR